MTEFTGNSSKAHEAAVNRFYGQFIDIYESSSDGELRSDEEKQNMLNSMTNSSYMTQKEVKVEDLSLPPTISQSPSETNEDEEQIKRVFRLFTCWLFDACGFGSAMNYMSAYKNILVRDVLGNESFFTIKHQHWYKALRNNLKDAYVQRCAETGIPLFNPPDSFTRAQLVQMLATLLRNGQPLSEDEELSLDSPEEYISSNIGADRSVENAALLCLDFILLGRIAEVGALRWNKLSYDERFKVRTYILIASAFW
jgi:hypothetical protein